MEDEEESEEGIGSWSDEERILGDPKHGKLNKEDLGKIQRRSVRKQNCELRPYNNDCLF